MWREACALMTEKGLLDGAGPPRELQVLLPCIPRVGSAQQERRDGNKDDGKPDNLALSVLGEAFRSDNALIAEVGRDAAVESPCEGGPHDWGHENRLRRLLLLERLLPARGHGAARAQAEVGHRLPGEARRGSDEEKDADVGQDARGAAPEREDLPRLRARERRGREQRPHRELLSKPFGELHLRHPPHRLRCRTDARRRRQQAHYGDVERKARHQIRREKLPLCEKLLRAPIQLRSRGEARVQRVLEPNLEQKVRIRQDAVADPRDRQQKTRRRLGDLKVASQYRPTHPLRLRNLHQLRGHLDSRLCRLRCHLRRRRHWLHPREQKVLVREVFGLLIWRGIVPAVAAAAAIPASVVAAAAATAVSAVTAGGTRAHSALGSCAARAKQQRRRRASKRRPPRGRHRRRWSDPRRRPSPRARSQRRSLRRHS
mmetsp:Transcript_14036/g.46088  ORF Transcript_14036/g.46088 Transcript_14036/m.46088 type:complete len:430 (+) Transcript_14036:1768-3057(+)